MIRMKLHLLLAETGLTQKDIADRLDIPKNTVSKYANNSFNMINKEHLDCLCKYFNCDISDIIEYINEPLINPNQLKLDLENCSNVIQKDDIDCKSNNWLTAEHKSTNPMDLIRRFNEQQERLKNYEKMKQDYENYYQLQSVKEKTDIEDFLSHMRNPNQTQFKKEIVDDVSNEVFKKLVEYFSTLEPSPNNKE